MFSLHTTDAHDRLPLRLPQEGRNKYLLFAHVGLLLSAPLLLNAYPTNPPLPAPGAAPGTVSCTGCHGMGSGAGASMTFPSGMTYTPGGPAVSVTVTGKAAVDGFQLSAIGGGTQAGSLAAGTGSGVSLSGTTQYGFQTAQAASWTLQWTPPATNVGNVTMYVAVVDSSQTYTNSYTLTPAAPPAPTMSVTPGTLTFNSSGGAAVPSQTFNVSSSGTAFSVTTSVSTTSGGSWLSASGSGTTPRTVTVSVNPAGMAAGSYKGTVSVTSSGASNSPQTVGVTLNVAAPPPAPNTLSVSPATLTFSYAGGSAPGSQSVMASSSPASVTFNMAVSTSTGGSWLSATPTSGTTPLNVGVSVNPAGLAAGTYTGMVTITSSGATGSPQTVNVTLNVTAAPPAMPTLSLSTKSITFSSIGGASVTPTSVNVSSSGSALSFTAAVATTSGGNWLSANTTSGTTPASLSISANPAGMTGGTYQGTVTFTASGASNGPQTVNVALTVSPSTPPPTTNPGTVNYSFNVLDKQSSGSDYLMLDGQGSTSNGQITGGGNYTQFTVATDGSHQTVAMGTWTAQSVVSYSPSSYGSTYGGVLDITVELDPSGGTPMTGSMRIAGTSTDKGVTLSLDGSSTFVQSGIGSVWVGSGASGGYCLLPNSSGSGRRPWRDE